LPSLILDNEINSMHGFMGCALTPQYCTWSKLELKEIYNLATFNSSTS